MKVLLVADKESAYVWDHFARENFAGVECVISCGDLKGSYLEFLATMLAVPVFYVPGNHDKSFAQNPPGGCENIDGKAVEIGGLRLFGFGGCQSPRRDVFEYTERDMKKRVSAAKSKLRRGVDILVTHAPALGLGDGDDLFHRGFECFRELLTLYTPKYHIYAHQHKAYGWQEPPAHFGQTRLINAGGHKIVDL